MKNDELLTRRTAFKSAIAGAAVISGASSCQDLVASVQEEIKTDKECIMAAGLISAEAECWEKNGCRCWCFL